MGAGKETKIFHHSEISIQAKALCDITELGPNGVPVNLDTLQRTAGGLMVWQQFTNTMRFTNGFQTWDFSACGLQTRLNTQTFVWETSQQIAAQAVPAPGTCDLT